MQLTFRKTHLDGNVHFQSHGVISVIPLLDLDRFFKVKCVFFNVLVLRISEKRYEIEQTIVLSIDRKLSICHRFAQLRMLYIMTFIYISRSRILKCSRYMNGCHKQLQIFAKFQRIFNPVCGNYTRLSFSPKKSCFLCIFSR